MGRFLTALRRGISAATDGPSGDRFAVHGVAITCPTCGHDLFIEGAAQLNTAGMTFLKLDWANRSATTLVCANCSRLEWFLESPDRQEA